MKLNLTTHNPTEERIKEYLEQNASETLAEKINNGTPITKDGKQLINRKTLDGFMNYAYTEAQKIAEKGARFACLDDDTVFGWSIHYFEEEAIEGELFNLDGTPYQAPKTTAPTIKTEKPKAPPKAPEKKPGTKAEAPKAEPKKATILTPPKAPAQPKPTEANPSQPKPTKKAKVIEHDPDQLSIFDLF